MEQLGSVLGDFPLIINTVPAMLLGAAELKRIRPQALVLDLASKPGGDDVGAYRQNRKKGDRSTLRIRKGGGLR